MKIKTLVYGLPSFDPRTDEPLGVSFCQGHYQIVTPLMGLTPLGVDTSNLSTGHTRTSGPYQVHSSVDGISPTKSNCEPHSFAGIFPTWRLNFVDGIPPVRGLDHHPVDGSYPSTESTHLIYRWFTPLLQILTKFTAPLIGFSYSEVTVTQLCC